MAWAPPERAKKKPKKNHSFLEKKLADRRPCQCEMKQRWTKNHTGPVREDPPTIYEAVVIVINKRFQRSHSKNLFVRRGRREKAERIAR